MKSFSGRIGSMYLLVAIIYLVLIVQGRSNPTGEKEKPVETVAQKRVHASGKQPNLEYAKPMEFDECAVAADNELCSKIGVEIFKKGGTAADAIVSTHCCVEIVNSHSTGLGGGGFMVYYDKKSGNATAYDFRETLPEAYSDSQNKTQGDTILVPGVLKGLHAVWKDYGRLKWGDLWKPCINLAKEGFIIHEALANAIVAKEEYISSNRALKKLFAPQGKVLKLGQRLVRPVLAKTYKAIAASGGSDIFYKGEIAKQIVDDVQRAGGKMKLSDLQNYKVNMRAPLKSLVKGLKILSTPAPGSGGLITLALKIMAHFNWTAENQYHDQGLKFHQMVEAFKMAYAPYTFLGDPGFTPHVEKFQRYMTDESTAVRMFKKIDKESHTVDYYEPFNKLEHSQKSGTSHISLIDPFGNGLGATTSINAYFGSKFRSEKLGFIYNNELSDFSEFWPHVYNLTTDKKIPKKRPMSKSSPTLFVDKNDNCVGVFGAAGGFFIPTCLIQTIANWLFFHNNIKVAVSKPRIHCQLFPPTIVYEPTFPEHLIPELERYGHAYVTNSTYDVSGQLNAIMGVVQAIVRLPSGKLNADCDYRKGGKPAGY